MDIPSYSSGDGVAHYTFLRPERTALHVVSIRLRESNALGFMPRRDANYHQASRVFHPAWPSTDDTLARFSDFELNRKSSFYISHALSQAPH